MTIFYKKKDLTNYYINTLPSEQTKTTQIAQAPKATVDINSVRDEFVKIKKENGVIRKFYNFLKNTTGLGLGSKKVEKEIDKFEKGKITQETLNENFEKYKASQKNGTQTAGDVATAAVSISSFMFATMH